MAYGIILKVYLYCFISRENKENSFCTPSNGNSHHLMKRQSIWDRLLAVFDSPSSERRPRNINYDTRAANSLRESRCKSHRNINIAIM